MVLVIIGFIGAAALLGTAIYNFKTLHKYDYLDEEPVVQHERKFKMYKVG